MMATRTEDAHKAGTTDYQVHVEGVIIHGEPVPAGLAYHFDGTLQIGTHDDMRDAGDAWADAVYKTERGAVSYARRMLAAHPDVLYHARVQERSWTGWTIEDPGYGLVYDADYDVVREWYLYQEDES